VAEYDRAAGEVIVLPGDPVIVRSRERRFEGSPGLHLSRPAAGENSPRKLLRSREPRDLPRIFGDVSACRCARSQ
jgi:hypothetical protein